MSELGHWWSPYRITFTFAQVTWVLRNIMEMREGIWPPNPDGRSSYIDPRIVIKGTGYKAYRETIGGVAGTIERRLLKTGHDGGMAYLRFTVDLSYSEIAKITQTPADIVEGKVDSAIRFSRGRYDKKSTYYQYKEIWKDYIRRKHKIEGSVSAPQSSLLGNWARKHRT